MDLFAFSQIDDLKHLLEENNINIPRLRGLDVITDENGNKVLYVHARIGGGNREYYAEDWEAIRNHSLFLYDEDDDFDCTYCDIYFRLEK